MLVLKVSIKLSTLLTSLGPFWYQNRRNRPFLLNKKIVPNKINKNVVNLMKTCKADTFYNFFAI